MSVSETVPERSLAKARDCMAVKPRPVLIASRILSGGGEGESLPLLTMRRRARKVMAVRAVLGVGEGAGCFANRMGVVGTILFRCYLHATLTQVSRGRAGGRVGEGKGLTCPFAWSGDFSRLGASVGGQCLPPWG